MNASKQQIFDAAWHGLKGQGFVKSVNTSEDAERWRQRGMWVCAMNEWDGGRSCAFQHAAKRLGAAVWELPRSALPKPRDGAHEGTHWTHDLILAHNDATSPPDMERRLREFATKYELTIPGDKPAQTFERFMAKVLSSEPVSA